MSRFFLRVHPLVLLLASSAGSAFGCGGNKPPSFGFDASMDARTDATSDADATTDSAVDPDAAVLPTACIAGAPVEVATFVGSTANSDLSLVAGATDAMVVLRTETSDGSLVTPKIRAHVLSGTTVSAGVTLTASGNTGDVRRPAVTVRGSAYLAAWSDPQNGNIARAIHVRDVAADGTVVGTMPTRISFHPDDFVALEPVSEGTLVVFQDTTTPYAVVIDATNTMFASANALNGSGISGRTVLATIGTTPFAVFRGTNGHLRSVSIAADASSAGTPHDVSMADNVGAGFDFGAYANGGGVAFETVSDGSFTEVRFRNLSSDGTAALQEPVLSGSTSEGHAPSLAPLAGGYLVAYRHEEGGTITLRLKIIDQLGAESSMDDGPTLTSTEGDVRVRVANDGNAYVVYEEPTMVTLPDAENPTAGTVVRFIRITCS